LLRNTKSLTGALNSKFVSANKLFFFEVILREIGKKNTHSSERKKLKKKPCIPGRTGGGFTDSNALLYPPQGSLPNLKQ